MSFPDYPGNKQDAPMTEINVTPLVDVMMVLLVIFIITAPLLVHGLPVNLPQVASQPSPEEPEAVTVAIDGEGQVFWNKEPVDIETLNERLAAAAEHDPQPVVRIRADRATRYQKLAEVMASAQNAGLTHLGFITEPLPK